MADYTGWLLLGGAAIGGVYLWSTGAFNSLFAPQQMPYPMVDPSAAFAPPAQPGPDPSAYYDNYGMIPGIQALIPTPEIIAQAPPEYLLPVPTCGFEPQLYYNPSIWAANKIWEMQYSQLAQTIAIRNQLALMRCGMVNFYTTIPWDVDFRNPFLHHLAVSRGIIAHEFHNGTRDSERANSAARDAATAVHPITTGHGHSDRTSTSSGPSPGQTTPPIAAGGGGSTHPTTMSHQATALAPTVVGGVTTTVAPYGGGTISVAGQPKAGGYDEAVVIPCVTGNC